MRGRAVSAERCTNDAGDFTAPTATSGRSAAGPCQFTPRTAVSRRSMADDGPINGRSCGGRVRTGFSDRVILPGPHLLSPQTRQDSPVSRGSSAGESAPTPTATFYNRWAIADNVRAGRFCAKSADGCPMCRAGPAIWHEAMMRQGQALCDGAALVARSPCRRQYGRSGSARARRQGAA